MPSGSPPRGAGALVFDRPIPDCPVSRSPSAHQPDPLGTRHSPGSSEVAEILDDLLDAVLPPTRPAAIEPGVDPEVPRMTKPSQPGADVRLVPARPALSVSVHLADEPSAPRIATADTGAKDEP